MARRPRPFSRTARAAHAFEGGTIASVDHRHTKISFETPGGFATAIALEKVVHPSPSKDMRQGIASRRRHVAPALSLC
jgi:hypothetical protein